MNVVRKKDKEIARDMLIAGKAAEDVSHQTGIPLSTVQKIDEWMHRRNSILWFEANHPDALSRYHPGYARRNNDSSDESVEEVSVPTPQPIAPTVISTPQPMPATISPQPVAPAYNLPNGSPTQTITVLPATSPTAYFQPPPQQSRMMMPVRENEETGTMQVLGTPRPVDIGSEPAAGKGRGNVNVTPMTLVWFDYMRSTGYDRDLPSFIEECTVGYFRKSGRKFVMVVDDGSG